MSKFVTGITIITINKNNNFIGKTVNSFASLSLNPPLVLFSIDKKSSSLKDYMKTSFMGINILSDKQKNLSKYFSTNKPLWGSTENFLSKNKIPMIKNALVNMNCKKIKTINIGDHIIFICKILEAETNDKIKPLIYSKSQYL